MRSKQYLSELLRRIDNRLFPTRGLTYGNRAYILRDGRTAYPAMLEAIARAQRHINLETYIFASDRTGWRFADALAERARAGLEVNVSYDAAGAFGTDERIFEHLRRAGARVLEFQPLAPWRPHFSWLNRNHRKTLIVDGMLGFTGGINISDEYAALADGGGGWRDTHLKIAGPAVRELQKLFLHTWNENHPEQLPEGRYLVAPPLAGDLPMIVHGNNHIGQRHRIRRAYLRAIKDSGVRIWITNGYFVPDRGVQRALINAAQRGVDVRLILAGFSDMRSVQFASRALYTLFLRNGVRIYEWQRRVLHAKIAVIDGIWSTVGSYNIDHRSTFHNLEVNVNVFGQKFAEAMERHFRRDLVKCHEIRLARWQRRPLLEKMLERVFYWLRHWL